ncbi:MAG: 2-oxoacid:ferredoxin oxidoreductase subunit gamma [Deltaproteobacteria bacterium RBG_13_43_22]|nr:MAG: 2-oxoacid:ferredoxin oxidoreductase subunit gamma [Deltaproteobacteria bacterium RBG_13_43_22]
MYFDVIIAGFGGQGVLLLGNLLTYAAMVEGRHVTYMPVYGVEMRGGTANCTVVISDQEIGSPVIHHPVTAVVMNKPSLVRFGAMVQPGGWLFVNSSLIDAAEGDYSKIKMIMVPTIELAAKAGDPRLANMAMLGAMIEETKAITQEAVVKAFKQALDKRYHKMIPINTAAIEEGARFIREGKR